MLEQSLRKAHENKTIIIPKLDNNHLFNKLKNLVNIKVIEMDPYTSINLDDELELCMIPQISEFADSHMGIGYSMDSSLIIYDKIDDTVFFNSVDNPLTAADFQKIFSNIRYDHIDLLTLPCASASEYPQAYLNIDRIDRKKLIEDNLELRLLEIIQEVKPSSLIKAGGSYALPHDYKNLEQYIPSLSESKLTSICKASQCTNYIPRLKNFQIIDLKVVNALQLA